jgi:hypothetical protein
MGNITPDGVRAKGVSNICPKILSREKTNFLSAAEGCLSFCVPLHRQLNYNLKKYLAL